MLPSTWATTCAPLTNGSPVLTSSVAFDDQHIARVTCSPSAIRQPVHFNGVADGDTILLSTCFDHSVHGKPPTRQSNGVQLYLRFTKLSNAIKKTPPS